MMIRETKRPFILKSKKRQRTRRKIGFVATAFLLSLFASSNPSIIQEVSAFSTTTTTKILNKNYIGRKSQQQEQRGTPQRQSPSSFFLSEIHNNIGSCGGRTSLTWWCLAAASRSTTGVATTPKKRKKNNPANIKINKNQEKKKQQNDVASMDDLVVQMGLKPVPKTTKTNKKRQQQRQQNNNTNRPGDNNSNSNIKDPVQQQQQQQQRQRRLPSLQAQLDYARNGHAVLRNYIDSSRLPEIREALLELGRREELKAWRQKVQVARGGDDNDDDDYDGYCETIDDCKKELERLGIPSDQLPFLQYFNTWRTIPVVKQMVLDLAETAAIFLNVPSVKLYQDSFFWKRRQDGPTPWHVDAKMAPFDTSSLVTFWIPLHDIPKDGSALYFVSKSHSDFALPFWNPYNNYNNGNNPNHDDDDDNPWNQLEERYRHNKIVHYMPLVTGDLTIHSGWTLHCADSQQQQDDDDDDDEGMTTTSKDRLALAISYVDAKAPIRPNILAVSDCDDDFGDDEDQWSYADWVNEVPTGKEFEHPLVPIVWPPP